MIAAPLKLKDVQQNDLVISGQKTVPMLVGPTGGKHAMEATATFRVAEVRDNILSLGKLVRKGFSFNSILLSVRSKLLRNNLFGSSETFGADKPIWAWLLRHAGWQISRYKPKGNGMTAYKQACG